MVKKYALISVYDKTGIVDFARVIIKSGYKIISTGGTAKILTENKIPVIPIQEITGNPESFEGRMKTISFQVESGILFDRSKPSHVKEAKKLKVPQIDIVVGNLYPFEETVKNPKSTFKDIIENIDVGGPTMIRSAAKNHEHVIVAVNPLDYPMISEALINDKLTGKFRRELAAKAFAHLSYYDSQIARYLTKDIFPSELTIPLKLKNQLRYGDNPDQQAGLYIIPNAKSPFENIEQLAGRGLSATNLTDIDAGMKMLQLLNEPAAVVIKHNNPCGVALGKSIDEALSRALDADSESAFGGVVVLNRLMTISAVKIIAGFKQSGKGQMDIIAAPEFNAEALELLKTIRKSTGLYAFGDFTKIPHENISIKHINGGTILQSVNDPATSFSNWKVVTKVKPTKLQLGQMQIAWKFISRTKSNTVAVIDPDLPMTRGIGSGQTSRILATKIALERAGKYCKGAILASDSFFPFDDSVKLAAAAGITAIVEQGGSIRDQDSIDAANKSNITMVFTGQRVFWH
jgi:phosphoribosylaminoimidazolecarboxamide formyltransferase / IMP cyclohydrolase